MRSVFLICFLLWFPGVKGAGKEIITQQHIWYDFTETIKVHPKWSVLINLGERHAYKPFAQSQTLPRAYFLHHFKSNWSIGAGFVNFWTWDGDLAVPELRPEQWFFYRQKFEQIQILTIAHRFKIEERFIHKTEGDALAAGYTFSMRFRYQIGAELVLFTTGKNNNPFKLRLSDEVMLQAGKDIIYNVFDQNRATAGFSYRPIEGLTFSASYMNVFRQRRAGNKFDHIHTLRLGIEHEIAIKQKQKTPKL
ncbi:MAG: DUF2490 domain-containing protein [Bacteroidota bacterium]